LWHWGDNGSFKCYVVAFPKQKIGVAMFMNGDNGLSIASEVVQLAIGGEQPAFQWIKYDRYDSPAMRFAGTAREKGAEAAIAEFRPALQQGAISEAAINGTGYQVLALKKTSDAIRIFQLNVELHPGSSNTYDSLGEAYMANGEKELAIKNYEKSLELNAKNNNAVEMLKRLKAE
jgi:tetratricopeptide (TPR) repeat protein